MTLIESITIPDGGHVIFAGDSHLDGPETPKAKAFLDFIAKAAAPERTLVLLGDIFYFYFESRSGIAPRFRWLLDSLDAASKKWGRIVLVRGNRDFLLGTTRAFPASLFVADDWLTIDMPSGIRLLVGHGDQIVVGDRLYWAFRAFMRSRFLSFCARNLPVWLACACADSLRWISFRRGGRNLFPDTVAAENLAERDSAQILVIGHFHRVITPGDLPDTHLPMFCIDEWRNNEPSVLVLGDGEPRYTPARTLHCASDLKEP